MRLLLLLIPLISFAGFAQDLVVVSKVDEAISIKWLPNNFEQLELICKGATISRAQSDKPTNFQLVNFTNAKTWEILPAQSRYDALGTSPEDQKFQALLEPILKASKDKEQQNFAMLTATVENMVNPRFQFVLGNAIEDTEFDKSKTYVYKIEIDKLPTVYIFVDPSKKTTYSAISEFELSLDRKKTVVVEWNSNAVQKEALGFLIEHAMDEQKEGAYLNDIPHIPFKSQFELEDKKATVIDDPMEGHWHYYRVHGLDPFGHPSLLSEWKRIYVPKLIHATAQIDTITANGSERIIQVSAALLKAQPNIEKWNLLRSENRETGYEVVVSQPYTDSLATFTLTGKPSGDHYYYIIQLINKDDSVSGIPYYFFTLDQERPDPPSAINGNVDSSGIVRLNWTASPDTDIKGYRVFRANQKSEEFVERTTRLSTELAFRDTLALDNLTSEIYYFVLAVDLNYNVSIASDTVLLLKPDTIAPMAAAFQGIKVVDTSLVIVWANSESEDLASTVLIRNEVDTIALAAGLSTYTDVNLVEAHHYSYQLCTEDKSGNVSYSQVVAQYYEPGYRKALTAFKVEVNREQKRVELSWQAPKDDVFSYQLFRSKNGAKLSFLKTISDPTQLQFIDTNLSIGTKYTYSIKYVNAQGIHSLPATMEIIY